jgi:hypothetical protein
VLDDAMPEVLNYRAKCFQLDLQGFTVEADEEGLQDLIRARYHSVGLYLGDEQLQREGTTKITREIFSGATDKKQNAQIFLENLEKLSVKPDEKDLRQMLSKAMSNTVGSVETRGDADSLSVDGGSGSFKIDVGSFKEMTLNRAFFSDTSLHNEDVASEKVINKEDVLINISPNKYEHAKDQLFLDFFKMYTQRSLKDADNKSSKIKLGSDRIRLLAETLKAQK